MIHPYHFLKENLILDDKRCPSNNALKFLTNLPFFLFTGNIAKTYTYFPNTPKPTKLN